jgi:hypothetical protein
MQLSVTLSGWTVMSRSAAMVLDIDAALILLPVCRNLISLARRTSLGGVIPYAIHLPAILPVTNLGIEGIDSIFFYVVVGAQVR